MADNFAIMYNNNIEKGHLLANYLHKPAVF